jgi:hypothetical protein
MLLTHGRRVRGGTQSYQICQQVTDANEPKCAGNKVVRIIEIDQDGAQRFSKIWRRRADWQSELGHNQRVEQIRNVCEIFDSWNSNANWALALFQTRWRFYFMIIDLQAEKVLGSLMRRTIDGL